MYDHILVPIDLEHIQASEKAVETACQMARDYNAVVHFLSVVAPLNALAASYFPKDYKHTLSEAASKSLHEYTAENIADDIQIQHIITHGAVYDQVIEVQQKISADLIVMASHRPELRDYLLGPNAARVVRHAPCTVMVVRP